jgi:isoleucyl-tRNA synthetase
VYNYKQVRDKSNGKVYVIAESRLGQLPVKAKASGKKQAPSKGSNAEAAQDGLDKESYELLVKIPGPYLVGLK